MKYILLFCLILAAGCHYSNQGAPLVAIQIQDRNGLTETVNNPDRLTVYETVDFFSSQPYKKVLRFFKKEGKNHSKITTYYPNGMIWQYLEAEEMRAHGAFREWFPNGMLKIEANVIGGTADVAPGSQQDWLFEGKSRVFDDQGRLTAEIEYQKGMLEGPSVYYFPNGQIEKEIHYAQNKLDGLAIEYTMTGEIKLKVNYQKGLKEGESLGFFENGKRAWVEEYEEGRLQKGNYYNPKEELISTVEKGNGYSAFFENKSLTLIEFRKGEPEGLVKKFTPFGELQRTYHLKNGAKQGEEIEYYTDSAFEGPKDTPPQKMSLMWNENKIHGVVKTWYNNGRLQSQRDFCRNKKQGSSLAWYRDGSLMLVEEYEEDSLVKGQYYKINSKEPVSSIFNGNGLATLYDEGGIFLRKIPYSKGKPIDLED